VLQTRKARGVDLFACKIAYGTKTLKFPERQGWDLIVQEPLDLVAFNLPVATRFDLDHILILPWRPDFFGCWTGLLHRSSVT
jgi:hypothetical protein